MRLPADATLLLTPGAEALEPVWREERLPVVAVADLATLEADLEAVGTATVVACDAAVAARAAALGYRTFLVGEAPAGGDVRGVTFEETLAAARQARARERWKAARSA